MGFPLFVCRPHGYFFAQAQKNSRVRPGYESMAQLCGWVFSTAPPNQIIAAFFSPCFAAAFQKWCCSFTPSTSILLSG